MVANRKQAFDGVIQVDRRRPVGNSGLSACKPILLMDCGGGSWRSATSTMRGHAPEVIPYASDVRSGPRAARNGQDVRAVQSNTGWHQHVNVLGLEGTKGSLCRFPGTREGGRLGVWAHPAGQAVRDRQGASKVLRSLQLAACAATLPNTPRCL